MQKKGFTLIELMIVVAIIAILAMIAVPVYSSYIEQARESAVLAFLEEIAMAEEAVASEGGVDIDGVDTRYIYVQGDSPKTNLEELRNFGFIPTPDILFAILPAGVDGPAGTGTPEESRGFVALAAFNATGSRVFVFNEITGTGGMALDEGTAIELVEKALGGTIPTKLFSHDGIGTTSSKNIKKDDDDVYKVD